MLRKVAMIGLLVMATAATARAGLPETPRLRQITVGDGLPSNVVYALAEDRDGLLWIGTGDGLARYDGVGFQVWRKEDGLPANHVVDLHVDGANRLWVATLDGLALLDRERGRFQRHGFAGGEDAGSANVVWSLAGTGDGAVWVGTGGSGLYRIDADGAVRRFMPDPQDPHSLPSAAVPFLEVAGDGTLWVGTRGGVARWTGEDFEVVAGLPDDPLLLWLAADEDGRVWVGLPQGAGVIDADGGFSQQLPWVEDDPRERIYSVLLRDGLGHYWLEVRGGLALASGEGIEPVRTYSGLRQGAVNPAWSAAHQDREGGLWLASTDAGLWYLPPDWRQFSVLMRNDDDPASLGNVDVTAIAPAASGSMWLVGNSGVLDLLDPGSGEVRHVYQDAEDYVPTAVLEDDAGNVWIGFHGGLARYDPGGGGMRMWHADDAGDAPPDGPSIALVQAGGLVWTVTTLGGLQARDREGTARETVRPGDGRGLEPELHLMHAARAPDGALWVSGQPGLLMWNSGTRTLEPVPGAPEGEVSGFAVEGNDRVWTARPGVLESWRWDGAGLAPELRLDHADGLPLVDFRGLEVDAEGVVWLTGTRGLVRVEPARGRINVFGVSHGLPSQEIATPPVARPSDGLMHVATRAGLVIFDPSSVRPDDHVPELAIKTVEVRGRDGVRQLDLANPLRLGYRDHELRVHARLAGFNAARHNRYRFFLHGYDAGWVETDAAGERVFPALAPGRYRLEVMGRTALSPWSEPTTFAFEVAAPWWRTWWALAAYAGVALLLGAMSVRAVRGRVRRRMAWQRVQDEREMARQASEAKSRFLATLGHEVRTPMTGVLGMSELLLKTPLDDRQRGYTESIRGAGNHLMRLVNDALDLARIEAGRLELDPQPFDPRTLVAEVGALMAPLARQRGLEYRVEVAAGLPAGLRGDPVRVRQILLNLLGNAIKFTERGSVGLEVQALAPAGIRFAVADTGPGLNEEQKSRLFRRFEQAEGARTASRYGGSGLGLAICQELAAEMGGRITVDSTPGKGTRFIVELPLPAAALPARAKPVPIAGAHGVRVLLVEDDPTVAEVVTGLLAAQGCAPTRVSHGLAALAEVQGGGFDLALLDLDLPGIDGIALAQLLRARGWDRPLVALTARADAAAEPLARRAGFDAFLRKPVSGEALAQAIAAVLEDAAALPLASRGDDRSKAEGSDGEMAAGGAARAGDAGDPGRARGG